MHNWSCASGGLQVKQLWGSGRGNSALHGAMSVDQNSPFNEELGPELSALGSPVEVSLRPPLPLSSGSESLTLVSLVLRHTFSQSLGGTLPLLHAVCFPRTSRRSQPHSPPPLPHLPWNSQPFSRHSMETDALVHGFNGNEAFG